MAIQKYQLSLMVCGGLPPREDDYLATFCAS